MLPYRIDDFDLRPSTPKRALYWLASKLVTSPWKPTSTAGTVRAVVAQWYQAVHGYVCVVVCVFGIAANVVNIVVLTRRNMVPLSTFTRLLPTDTE